MVITKVTTVLKSQMPLGALSDQIWTHSLEDTLTAGSACWAQSLPAKLSSKQDKPKERPDLRKQDHS